MLRGKYELNVIVQTAAEQFHILRSISQSSWDDALFTYTDSELCVASPYSYICPW
jgi:hypothetical protein